MQEGQGTGRTSRCSSSSGRESRESNGGRERTGRNIISSDSARVSHGSGGASVDDVGGSIGGVDGLFSSKSRDSGGENFSRRKTVPEPPPYHDDDTAVTPEPQLPVSSTFSVPARSTAPASTVPKKNGDAHRAAARAGPGVVAEEPVYLVTDTYPYTYKQFDRQDEDRLLVSKRACVVSFQVCWRIHLATICVGVEICSKIPDGQEKKKYSQVFRLSACRRVGQWCELWCSNPVPCLREGRISVFCL